MGEHIKFLKEEFPAKAACLGGDRAWRKVTYELLLIPTTE